MQNIGIHQVQTKKQTNKRIKKTAKKIAKRMAKRIISEKLKKAEFGGTIPDLKRKNKINKLVHKFIFGIALIGPLLTIPQILTIWIERNATGISIFTWGAYVISNVCWLAYGIIQEEKAIIFSNILRVIVNIAVTIGAIMYG